MPPHDLRTQDEGGSVLLMKTIGSHLLCELTGCQRSHLTSVAFVEREIRAAAAKANATVLNGYFHQFSPEGVSGLLCLAESHISIHTWPETGYAAIDIYTCGDSAMPRKAIEHLIEVFEAKNDHVVEITRGVHDDGGRYVSVPATRAQVESAEVNTTPVYTATPAVMRAPGRTLKRYTPQPLM